MKYHLDTIPVWDTYHEESECPFCILEHKSETVYVDSFLGGSVMEPATRIEVNDKGFCPHHNQLLYQAQNRLGLALMTHTHILETIKKLEKQTEDLEKAAENPDKGLGLFTKKLSGGDSNLKQAAQKYGTWLANHKNQCIICDRLHNALKQFAYTFIHLWGHDKEFHKVFQQSRGFCFSHLPLILDMSSECLNSAKLAEFLRELLPIQMNNIDRLEKELYWFTQKFDYKNQDKPWGNSKDALTRKLQKITGTYME